MAEFFVPENSKIRKGLAFSASDGGKVRAFKIYRYNPDIGDNPISTYSRSRLKIMDQLVVNAVLKLKGEQATFSR
jgi:succinate dehydrogenase / fumarate reductase iron-sulfur subunit